MPIATNSLLWFTSMDEENRPKEDVYGRKVMIVEELSKAHGKMVAIDNISFEVFEGEIFGMVGPNGAGKTRGRDSALHFSRRNSDIAKNIQMRINKADIVHRVRWQCKMKE